MSTNASEYQCAWQKTVSGKESLKGYRRRLRLAAVAKLGGKCSNPACQWLNADGTRGCADERCLQIDHKEGGGCKEQKRIGTHGIYLKIVKGAIEAYQLLCANCNWIKRAVNNENNEENH